MVSGSQRDKDKIVALQARKTACKLKKRAGQGELSLLDSQSLSMGVFSDDFAAVDFREVLCYHSRPKKRKFRGDYTTVRVQKTSVIFLEALHLTFRKIIEFDAKIAIKTAF